MLWISPATHEAIKIPMAISLKLYSQKHFSLKMHYSYFWGQRKTVNFCTFQKDVSVVTPSFFGANTVIGIFRKSSNINGLQAVASNNYSI